MYLGEQLISPTDERMRLSAQLGVSGIVIDTRPNFAIQGDDGAWDAGKVAALRRWVEGFGMRLEVMALDVGSVLLDSLRQPDRAQAIVRRLRKDIQAAADGGVDTLKYTVAMVGITRTGVTEGRGGMKCSTFRAADYKAEADARFSYWGVVLPEDGTKGAQSPVEAKGAPETCGQVMASEAGGISEAEGWKAIEYLVGELLPTAEKAGVRLACHPHDPAYPPGGLNGVHHVLGSIGGMRRFIALAPESRSHGFNFCQGTVAEMSPNPTEAVLEAIGAFGPASGINRIFMVHFRNIKGGYLDFREAMPDEGSVDMLKCIAAYRDAGYAGILCPDHVPLSDVDPGRERFFSFCLGYTRGLLQAAGVRS
ncbi:mannonate dehydratase [Telmatospirillum siberiense]|uniref:mannonate dehydratase n=1 Tax=Telmatospirillum siberiense TaxID=382514 RepID=A0A2N3PRW9_9PROT|nr:mannonate dehydratase [Telmatospirillum siberiense]PKU23135.1 mannonate dehydratase [Telmatospirillum siberiense]